MATSTPPRTDQLGSGNESREEGFAIIDCDVHPYLPNGISSVLPYAQSGWRERLTDHAAALLPGSRYAHPVGTNRSQAVPLSGGPAASDPRFMSSDLLDAYNIHRAILMPLQATLVSASPYPAEGAALACAFNDYFAAEWLGSDERYRLAMVVAPQDPAKAATEIRRVGNVRGVVSVWLPPINIPIGNSFYHPIYEAAAELDLPIVVHPLPAAANFQGTEQFAGGLPSSYPERFVNYIQLGQAGLSSIIFEGVLQQFPTLKIVFAEYGWTWLPSVLWRMDSAWKAMRRDVPWVQRPPSEYVRDHVRFTTQPVDEPPHSRYLRQLAEMCDAHKLLLFSTDYPHWDQDEPDFILQALGQSARPEIFTQNPYATFGSRLD